MSMHLQPKELGTIQVWLQRFNHYRLPRLQDLKAQVDSGKRLEEFDLNFLENALEELKNSGNVAFAAKHPEFQTLAAEVVQLYHHITKTALTNERNVEDSNR